MKMTWEWQMWSPTVILKTCWYFMCNMPIHLIDYRYSTLTVTKDFWLSLIKRYFKRYGSMETNRGKTCQKDVPVNVVFHISPTIISANVWIEATVCPVYPYPSLNIHVHRKKKHRKKADFVFQPPQVLGGDDLTSSDCLTKNPVEVGENPSTNGKLVVWDSRDSNRGAPQQQSLS